MSENLESKSLAQKEIFLKEIGRILQETTQNAGIVKHLTLHTEFSLKLNPVEAYEFIYRVEQGVKVKISDEVAGTLTNTEKYYNYLKNNYPTELQGFIDSKSH